MKKTLLFTLFTLVAAGNAQIVEKNSEGKYRIQQKESWQEIGIIAEGKAQQYANFFDQAISQPGDTILVKEIEVILKFKPVFKKLVEVEKGSIVYNDSTQKITYVELKSEQEKKSYLILIPIFSIFFMVMSNIAYCRYKEPVAVFAFAGLAFAGFAFAFALAFAIALAGLAFALASLTAAHANENKKSIIFTIIYCICMALYVLFLFLGI